MIEWVKNADLTSKNSFGFSVTAERFFEIDTIDQLEAVLDEVEKHQWPLLVLGGGSNLILNEHIPGAVISIARGGVQVLVDDESEAIVEVGAGQNWHQFIGQLLEMGLHGLENLALIPGSVGAAPVQNIGAYGVELADCFHSLTAYDRVKRELIQLNKEDCCFGYRDSIFKSRDAGRYIIWQVRFCLSTVFNPSVVYKALAEYLSQQGIAKPNAHDVYKAVCEIRTSKLPIPSVLGNAGSFFENPVVDERCYSQLKTHLPELVAYPDKDGYFKLAAGWLIDQAGWKGKRLEGTDIGVYDKQALVLVNHGKGTIHELLILAQQIKDSVKAKFGIDLKMEPRIYPSLIAL